MGKWFVCAVLVIARTYLRRGGSHKSPSDVGRHLTGLKWKSDYSVEELRNELETKGINTVIRAGMLRKWKHIHVPF